VIEAITVDQIVKRYNGLVALDDVCFGIRQGETVSIMGPSGSGKTTLINLMAGLDTPTSGRILVQGKDISSMNQAERARLRRENIGFIFQQFHLIPYLTALENVMLAQYLHSIPDKNEAIRALEAVELADRQSHLACDLSGGEQQRVAIARAIINEPSILLADEPTGNLDAANEKIVLKIFERLKKEGKTIVIVTHNHDVAGVADRMVAIRHGRISLVVTHLPGKLSKVG
jgi:putative ABC transport system ATP-binding protein